MRDNRFPPERMAAWIAQDRAAIARFEAERERPTGNPAFEPQFLASLAEMHLHLLLRRYAHGDPVAALGGHLAAMVEAWEASDRLGRSVWTAAQWSQRHDWRRNPNAYQRCFWVAALAMSLDWPDAQWPRLLALMGNAGEDSLLDRVLATRQPGRAIGATLCHPHWYQGLLDVLDAPAGAQGDALRRYVTGWYAALAQPSRALGGRAATVEDLPYWYGYAEIEGAYFGHWCLEAVAVVRAFGVDDGGCLGLPTYPGDLVHPHGPSTHRAEAPAGGGPGDWWSRLRGAIAR